MKTPVRSKKGGIWELTGRRKNLQGLEFPEHGNKLPENLEIKGYIEHCAHAPDHHQVEYKRPYACPKQVLIGKEEGCPVVDRVFPGRLLENRVELLNNMTLVFYETLFRGNVGYEVSKTFIVQQV